MGFGCYLVVYFFGACVLESSRYDDKSRALELCGLRHQVMVGGEFEREGGSSSYATRYFNSV